MMTVRRLLNCFLRLFKLLLAPKDKMQVRANTVRGGRGGRHNVSSELVSIRGRDKILITGDTREQVLVFTCGACLVDAATLERSLRATLGRSRRRHGFLSLIFLLCRASSRRQPLACSRASARGDAPDAP